MDRLSDAAEESNTTVEVERIGPFVASELDKLFGWIREREAIRKAKHAGLPKPWTTDALLRDYRFCNVSRMDDRVSLDLMQHWYIAGPFEQQLVAAALARLVNWPDTLLDIAGGPFTLCRLPDLRAAFHARVRTGMRCWTAAYVIPGEPGRSKVDSILDLVERIASDASSIYKPTLRGTWERLTQYRNIGSFLAGQITADLAQLEAGAQWPDRLTWAPVGPGSSRGLNRLLGRKVERRVPQAEFDGYLATYMRIAREVIPQIDSDRRLCAQDYQSTWCEFAKLRAMQDGTGHMRARYDGAGPAANDPVDQQRSLF